MPYSVDLDSNMRLGTKNKEPWKIKHISSMLLRWRTTEMYFLKGGKMGILHCKLMFLGFPVL